MCGRFSLRLNRHEIQALPGHNVDVDEWIDEEEFIPRYNIAPRTQAPVIRRRDAAPGSSARNNDALVMQTMKWGLVPHWSKFEDKSLNTTNARSENLIEGGGMWASIKGKNRCAVPCQGYYEWLTKGKDKLPHFTKRKDGKLLLMAGLYDSVVLEGKTLWTFTIVTTDANKEFAWLHDRQPVFLSNKDELERWLDTSSQMWSPKLAEMLHPYSDTSVPLECYAVPKEVGKVGTESPSFIEPIQNRKDGIEAMFSKQKQMSSPTKPAKRKAHETPTRETSPPEKLKSEASKASLKLEEEDKPITNASGSKRRKIKYKDDSSQLKTFDCSVPLEGSSESKSKPKPAPVKKKPNKKAPAGNAKISSFFRKA